MNQPTEQSDTELLNRLEDGCEDAATELYHRYADRLIRLADRKSSEKVLHRVGAEDIVQSVFRTFFRRAATGHYRLPDGDELWKLFLVISLNKIRTKAGFHQAKKRDVSRTQTLGDYQPAGADTTAEILRLTIEELISGLPEKHQGVVRDRISGYEVQEMSSRHNLSRRTVERILQVFRQRLKQELTEPGDG